jgi:hypothetical protein
MDLNSTNGLYLNKTKIAKSVPITVRPGGYCPSPLLMHSFCIQIPSHLVCIDSGDRRYPPPERCSLTPADRCCDFRPIPFRMAHQSPTSHPGHLKTAALTAHHKARQPGSRRLRRSDTIYLFFLLILFCADARVRRRHADAGPAARPAAHRGRDLRADARAPRPRARTRGPARLTRSVHTSPPSTHTHTHTPSIPIISDEWHPSYEMNGIHHLR